MRHVHAPEPFTGPGPSLFLAGGITGCPDWQARAAAMLAGHNGLTVLNPRRPVYEDDERVAVEQITWEHEQLHRADVVLFWFAGGGSVQPITLYELGVHATRGAPLVVGADRDYPRRLDVRVQLGLARPELTLHDSLAETVAVAGAAAMAGAGKDLRLR
ncbi:hypothetical protein GCM10010435_90540 [Winogradskya consettensis]|uniref:Nucleoside 2-deoxyribosyltransferase n=1 Tax=Winogradskya consettensis TaxID=113560 RepID=A0A919SX46_9ACTN|nr:nucleoside 2-deoxyribosyltransferase domain-containing protein [Actinoplanes consettensis]GIM79955.1 hypothetical protein Aco04nite_68170 [Actinoplanes consettensis]